MNSFETILLEIDGHTGLITINRPQVLNALNATVIRELSDALTACERDENVRSVILTGAGEKAFVAGADIGELNALKGAADGTQKARIGQALTLQIEKMSKPVIMAVNGFALGGGCELAMAGDIRIASEKAKFGQPEVNLGLIPGYGGSQRTTRLVGKGMAMYLCLSGEIITAETALKIGLVESVVPPEELMNACKKLAETIAQKAPLAVAACKHVINGAAHMPIAAALDEEAIAFGQLVKTEDFREGTSAFLEKRKPVWTGK